MFDAWVRTLNRRVGLLLLLGFPVLGVSYAFLMPPFQVPDERRHWLAAHYHLAELATGEGTVCSTDVGLDRHFQIPIAFHPERKLPSGIFSAIDGIAPDCEEQLQEWRGNVFSYPGVMLTRLFVPREPTSGRQSLYAFYLARLLDGALIGLLLFRLWWLAGSSGATGPPGLLALLLLALSPLFLQQSFGVTSDVVGNAFALALATWLVLPERRAWFDDAALFAFGLIAALTKPVLALALLPIAATGFYLEALRRDPAASGSAVRALRAAVARRRGFATGLVALSVVGLAYALGSGGLQDSRGDIDSTQQLEYIAAHPERVFRIIAKRIGDYFRNPSAFFDYLGYLDTRPSAATFASFAQLAVGIALVEALGLWRRGRALARDPERRRALRRSLGRIGGLAGIALAALAVSMFMIGFMAYLVWTPVGSHRVYSVQPRYFFPHLFATLGLLVAIARTVFDAGAAGSPPAAGRFWRFGEAAILALLAATLGRFAVRLSIDLLGRYS